MPSIHGSCHCGAVSYRCEAPDIDRGLRCNCSICRRKGALMSEFVIPKAEMQFEIEDGALSTYRFDSGIAQHHFCNRCGIYVFHETMRQPGHYRLNLGCVDGLDSFALPVEVFDGASL